MVVHQHRPQIGADALTLGASKVARFEYGWVRGAGSAAFIAGVLVSGQFVGAWGLEAIVWSQALLLFAAAFAATRIAEMAHPQPGTRAAARAAGATECVRKPLLDEHIGYWLRFRATLPIDRDLVAQ